MAANDPAMAEVSAHSNGLPIDITTRNGLAYTFLLTIAVNGGVPIKELGGIPVIQADGDWIQSNWPKCLKWALSRPEA